MSVAEGGPAAAAGMRRGDIISECATSSRRPRRFLPQGLEQRPGRGRNSHEVIRDGRETWLRVKSADRNSFLRKPQLQ